MLWGRRQFQGCRRAGTRHRSRASPGMVGTGRRKKKSQVVAAFWAGSPRRRCRPRAPALWFMCLKCLMSRMRKLMVRGGGPGRPGRSEPTGSPGRPAWGEAEKSPSSRAAEARVPATFTTAPAAPGGAGRAHRVPRGRAATCARRRVSSASPELATAIDTTGAVATDRHSLSACTAQGRSGRRRGGILRSPRCRVPRRAKRASDPVAGLRGVDRGTEKRPKVVNIDGDAAPGPVIY